MTGISTGSFWKGFATALLIVGVVWGVRNTRVQGAQEAASPDGRYRLWISTSLNPGPGDPYEIALFDEASGDALRKVTVALSPGEPTEPLREQGQVMFWSEDNSHAEIRLGDRPILRIYAPQ